MDPQDQKWSFKLCTEILTKLSQSLLIKKTNLSLSLSETLRNVVSVAFHQVVRAMTPVFTIAISIVFLSKRYSFMTYLSLLPLLLGVYMATVGDYSYTPIGFFLTVLGTVLAATKTVVTNRIQIGRLQLHPLDLLLRMSPLAFVQTVIFSWMKGELDEVVSFCKTEMSLKLVLALLVNGIIAFFLNYVSFTANKKTSALTMTVAGMRRNLFVCVDLFYLVCFCD